MLYVNHAYQERYIRYRVKFVVKRYAYSIWGVLFYYNIASTSPSGKHIYKETRNVRDVTRY